MLAARLLVPLALSVLVAGPAAARSDFVDLPVQYAKESSIGQAKLLQVPFFMKGQQHKKVARVLGTYDSNKRTNAFNKTDEEACQIAFLSAIISLQGRAQQLGGDAVVEIVSITKNNRLESTSEYRCNVGNVIANVALKAQVVKFAE